MAISNTIKEFRAWHKDHYNFMTPYLKKTKIVNDKTIIELSEGTDFNHKAIYGVTVIIKVDNGFKSDNGLSNNNKLFYELKEASNYIKTLSVSLMEGI